MTMKRPKWLNLSNAVVVIPLVVILAMATTLYISQQSRISDLTDRVSSQHSRIDELTNQNQFVTKQYVQAYGQAKANGVEPTTAPPSTLPKVGATGAAGASGKDGRGVAFSICTAPGWIITYTDGETENAGPCEGTDGKPGVAGKAGADGKTGSTGLPGATGAVGAPGVNGTNGVDGKDGAPGAPGKDGANGQDGRGIASVTCVDGPAFRFTYTDGTTTDIPGACEAPIPTPAATPAG